jgi:hypothetical protein
MLVFVTMMHSEHILSLWTKQFEVTKNPTMGYITWYFTKIIVADKLHMLYHLTNNASYADKQYRWLSHGTPGNSGLCGYHLKVFMKYALVS